VSDLKIALIQCKNNVAKTPSDIKTNALNILQKYNSTNCDIALLPELSVCGYIPHDLLFYNDFVEEIEAQNNFIIKNTDNKILLLPTITKSDCGTKLYNSIVACKNGQIVKVFTKQKFPNTSIFCESRYFSSNSQNNPIIIVKNIKIGILICEDIWHFNDDNCPVEVLVKKGADLILTSNASPYNISKQDQRLLVAKNIYEKYKIPIFYCNCFGNCDGIIFDGSSFVYADNKKYFSFDNFKDHSEVFNINKHKTGNKIEIKPLNTISKKNETPTDILYKALVFGLKNFISSIGFSKVVIGLSGGADSAFVLKLASDCFEPQNIFCYGLKTIYTSQQSIDDATNLVANISPLINFEMIDIEPFYGPFVKNLDLKGLNLQNIQARVRANILLAKTVEKNAALLTTGNKSEIATGYCTIYGDMCGAYNPIKDLYKTQIFYLMNYINQKCNKDGNREIFPSNIIIKSPSAELDFNQKDSDNLPDYKILDAILFLHIECKLGFNKIANLNLNQIKLYLEKSIGLEIGLELRESNITKSNSSEPFFSTKDIELTSKLILKMNYKRRQSAPGTIVSTQSFEHYDWRFNI